MRFYPFSMALTKAICQGRLFWRWHGVELTEFFVFILPGFYSCSGGAAGDCHSGHGRGFIFWAGAADIEVSGEGVGWVVAGFWGLNVISEEQR